MSSRGRAAASREGGMMRNIETRLSTLWVVVMFNVVFADILSFLKPGALQEMPNVTPGLLLAFALLLEIPIAMIFRTTCSSRRWKSQTASRRASGGTWTPHYLFFATVEVACMALIVWSALAWRRSETAASAVLAPPAVRSCDSV